MNLTLTLTDEQLTELATRVAGLLGVESQRATQPDLLTPTEAAEYLRCKPQRIYDLTSSRRLIPVKDGTRSLFRKCDIDTYLKENA